MAEVRFAYKPFPVHIPFHRSTARERLALGAVGSGKTIALCADAITFGLEQPGSRIMIARKTLTRLKDTTEREFVGLLGAIPADLEGIQKHTLLDLCKITKGHGHIDMLILPNGTEYLFRSIEDWKGLMSLNLAAIYIDEASEVVSDAYHDLISRLRQNEPLETARRMGYKWPGKPRHTMALAANPNGHNWIWDLFINPKTVKPQLGREYFRSSSFENPTLYNSDGTPGDYLISLLAQPQIWQDRYVWCRDDAFAGQILNFDVNAHTCDAFIPPKDWERAMGLDWGQRSPTACVWWARNPNTGVWTQYREWQTYDPTDRESRESYVTATVHDVAKKIKEIEYDANEIVKYRAADPQIAERQASDGKSLMFWFSTYGLRFTQGLKHHEPRINALNSLLVNNHLQITNACPQSIVAFQQYRWAETKLTSGEVDAPERPRKKDDHLVDASQYIATVLIPNLRTTVVKEHKTHDDMIWDEIRAQNARIAQGKKARTDIPYR